MTLDTGKLCENLTQLFGRIDDLLARADDERGPERQEAKPPAPGLAHFPGVLRLFQLLWSSARNQEMSEVNSLLTRQFPSVLRGLGLEVVKPTDEELASASTDAGDLTGLFDVDSSPEVTGIVLDYPPIRRSGTVVLKGRILIPEVDNR